MDKTLDNKRSTWIWYIIVIIIVIVIVVIIIMILNTDKKLVINKSIIEDIINEDNIIKST